jgi:ribosomal protein S18 acetylase RimI-like enzyme
MEIPEPPYLVRRYGGADWRRLREIRLEMLADTPLAYVESRSAAEAYDDERWRERAAWADEPHHLGLAVVPGGTGRWIGLACCAARPDLGDRAFVFSVYVAPAVRGRGVADQLFDRVEDWAGAEGHRDLFLFVHESNPRAIAFYRRRGYLDTGAREPYRLDPTQSELELRLRLPRTSRVDGRVSRPPR